MLRPYKPQQSHRFCFFLVNHPADLSHPFPHSIYGLPSRGGPGGDWKFGITPVTEFMIWAPGELWKVYFQRDGDVGKGNQQK